jgi:hypothetical protein
MRWQYVMAITVPKMTVLNTGRFAGLLRGQCPETPHTVFCGRRVPKRHRTLGVSYPFGNRPLTQEVTEMPKKAPCFSAIYYPQVGEVKISLLN